MNGERAVGVLLLSGLTMTFAPSPVAADGSLSNFPWSTTVVVPPGGMQYTGSPVLPSRARAVKVTVLVDNSRMLLALHTILASLNKRSRTLFCARFGEGALRFGPDTRAGMQGLSLTLACFQMIQQIPVTVQAISRSASMCPAVQYRAPTSMTRSGGQYVTTLNGAPRPAARGPLRLRCVVRADSVNVTVKTRKHKPLRKYVGSQLFLGFGADETADQPVTARVTYRSAR